MGVSLGDGEGRRHCRYPVVKQREPGSSVWVELPGPIGHTQRRQHGSTRKCRCAQRPNTDYKSVTIELLRSNDTAGRRKRWRATLVTASPALAEALRRDADIGTWRRSPAFLRVRAHRASTWRFLYETGEERFETEAFKGGLTRIGGSRCFFDYGGRRISEHTRSGGTVTRLRTENSSRRGGDLRRKLGDFLRLRERERLRPGRQACSGTRRLRRSWRLRRLRGTWCRYRLRAWRPWRLCRPSRRLGWLWRSRLQRLQRLRRLRLWRGLMDRRLRRLWWRLWKLFAMGSGPGLGLRLLS